MPRHNDRVRPRDSTAGTHYGISDLAEDFGVTTRTLRFYENRGLLTPQRQGQRRIYSRRDRTRLKLILRGKRLGMTLAEIAEVFDLYDMADGEERQLERYLEILQEKRASLLRQRQDLEDALRELQESEHRCRELLKAKRGRQEREAARRELRV